MFRICSYFVRIFFELLSISLLALKVQEFLPHCQYFNLYRTLSSKAGEMKKVDNMSILLLKGIAIHCINSVNNGKE